MGIQPLIIDIIHRLDLLDLFDIPTPGLDVQRRPAFPLALTSDPIVFAKQERFALMPRRTSRARAQHLRLRHETSRDILRFR